MRIAARKNLSSPEVVLGVLFFLLLPFPNGRPLVVSSGSSESASTGLPAPSTLSSASSASRMIPQTRRKTATGGHFAAGERLAAKRQLAALSPSTAGKHCNERMADCVALEGTLIPLSSSCSAIRNDVINVSAAPAFIPQRSTTYWSNVACVSRYNRPLRIFDNARPHRRNSEIVSPMSCSQFANSSRSRLVNRMIESPGSATEIMVQKLYHRSWPKYKFNGSGRVPEAIAPSARLRQRDRQVLSQPFTRAPRRLCAFVPQADRV
jgi:hypothetical protein